jgi:hypothetical protein
MQRPCGIVSQTATVSGSFTYVVTCFEGSASVKSQATITVSAAAASGGATSSKGGGGSLGLAELFAMLALLAILEEGNAVMRNAEVANRHQDAFLVAS